MFSRFSLVLMFLMIFYVFVSFLHVSFDFLKTCVFKNPNDMRKKVWRVRFSNQTLNRVIIMFSNTFQRRATAVVCNVHHKAFQAVRHPGGGGEDDLPHEFPRSFLRRQRPRQAGAPELWGPPLPRLPEGPEGDDARPTLRSLWGAGLVQSPPSSPSGLRICGIVTVGMKNKINK